jgi:transposase-like protein
MTFIAVRCLHCHSEQIVKRGKTRRGTQRYLCQNTTCTRGSFLLDYRNRGCLPEVKQQIIDMSLNANGVRDTARVLRIGTDTVLSELKKKEGTRIKRLVRKTICFSKSTQLHDIVIGLFVNRYAFGRAV